MVVGVGEGEKKRGKEYGKMEKEVGWRKRQQRVVKGYESTSTDADV